MKVTFSKPNILVKKSTESKKKRISVKEGKIKKTKKQKSFEIDEKF